MSNLKVRMARVEDAEQIVRLRKHIDKSQTNKNPPLDPYGGEYPTLDQQRSEIKEYSENGIFLVAVSEEKYIGFAFCFEMHNRPGEYRLRFAVKDEWRGKGVGTELVSQVVEWGRNHSEVKSIICSFHRSYKAAKHLLEKSGFKMLKQGLVYYVQAALFNATEMILILRS